MISPSTLMLVGRNGGLLKFKMSNYGINHKITIIPANRETFIIGLRPVLEIKIRAFNFFMMFTPQNRSQTRESMGFPRKFETNTIPNLLTAIKG